jgi:hypothetical protein
MVIRAALGHINGVQSVIGPTRKWRNRMMRLLLIIISLNSVLAQTAVEHHNGNRQKDAKTAFWLSFGSTAGTVIMGTLLFNKEVENGRGVTFYKTALTPSVAVITAGMIVGPSLGLIYADDSEAAMRHLLIRGSAGVIALASLETFFHHPKHKPQSNVALAFLSIGATGVILSSAIEDIKQAPRSARAFNQKIAVYPLCDPETRNISLGMTMQID